MVSPAMDTPSIIHAEQIGAFFWTFLSIVGVVLMLLTYMYITKLERINCACAEHPYKNFMKNYIIFAVIFLAITAFMPPSQVVGMAGETCGIVYAVITWVYNIATIVFFVYALQYVRFLVREKCQCSEDIRREVLYWWSIIELVILSILVLLPFLIVFVSGGVALSIMTGKDAVSNMQNSVMMTTVNPLKGAKNATNALSSSIKKGLSKVKNFSK
jgi:flagellar biosynthesis protein FlhB